MSLSVSQTQLKGAMKDLTIKWDQVTSKWNDSASQAFEKDVIAQLEPRIRGALSAMDHIGAIMHQARRDCE